MKLSDHDSDDERDDVTDVSEKCENCAWNLKSFSSDNISAYNWKMEQKEKSSFLPPNHHDFHIRVGSLKKLLA